MSGIPTLHFRWIKRPTGEGLVCGDGNRLVLQQYHEYIDAFGTILGEWQDVPLVDA